jgi:hypothetical protein
MEVLPCQFQNPERRGIFFIKKGGVAAGFLADIAIHNNIISSDQKLIFTFSKINILWYMNVLKFIQKVKIRP